MFTGLSYEVISVTHAISVKYPIRKDRKTKQNSDCLCSVPESTPPMDSACGSFSFFILCDVCSDYVLKMHRLPYTNIIKLFTRKHLGSIARKDVVAWGGRGGELRWWAEPQFWPQGRWGESCQLRVHISTNLVFFLGLNLFSLKRLSRLKECSG